MFDGTGAMLSGLAALVSATFLGAPSLVRAYIDLQRFHDERRLARNQAKGEVAELRSDTEAPLKRTA